MSISKLFACQVRSARSHYVVESDVLALSWRAKSVVPVSETANLPGINARCVKRRSPAPRGGRRSGKYKAKVAGETDRLDDQSGFLYVEFMASEVTKYLSRIGRRGGLSKSFAKLAAVRANLKRAQAARRKYPRCPRYKNRSHRFSPTTKRCPCGYAKPTSRN
jgi:hypothetical protein